MSSNAESKKTEYANHHYVPKLLLKRFATKDGIHVGLMSSSSGEVRPSIPYKPQCAKHYFYGKDLVIEKKLGEIETKVGVVIDEIMSTPESNIEKLSVEHVLLTIFSVYQYVRTEKALKLANEVVEKNFSIAMKHAKPELINRLDKVAEGRLSEQELLAFCDSVSVSMTDPHSILFEIANSVLSASLQLEMKLLRNDTSTPFLISDNPLIYMNEGDEDCFYRMLLPLTPNLLLVFYEGRNYKIGLKKSSFHKIVNATDVFYLNALQYLNSNKNTYFSTGMPVKHLESLHRSFKKLRFNEATTLTELDGQTFLRTNRPRVNHRFSFAKKIGAFDKSAGK